MGVDPVSIEIGLATLFGLALTLGGAGLVAFGAQPGTSVHAVQPVGASFGTTVQPHARPDVGSAALPAATPVAGQLGQPGHAAIAGQIVEIAKTSNGRLDRSVRGLAALIGKPKSTVHVALTALVSAGVLCRAGDGAGYVLAS